jgi:hypothetical protein
MIVGEGVQQVPVVGDLVAVGVADHGELAGQSGGGRMVISSGGFNGTERV